MTSDVAIDVLSRHGFRNFSIVAHAEGFDVVRFESPSGARCKVELEDDSSYVVGYKHSHGRYSYAEVPTMDAVAEHVATRDELEFAYA